MMANWASVKRYLRVCSHRQKAVSMGILDGLTLVKNSQQCAVITESASSFKMEGRLMTEYSERSLRRVSSIFIIEKEI